jgi:hypothetical protein
MYFGSRGSFGGDKDETVKGVVSEKAEGGPLYVVGEKGGPRKGAGTARRAWDEPAL